MGNSNERYEIEWIQMAGPAMDSATGLHVVGKRHFSMSPVVSITEIEVNGQMAPVKAYLVSYEDGSYSEVLGAHVAEVYWRKVTDAGRVEYEFTSPARLATNAPETARSE